MSFLIVSPNKRERKGLAEDGERVYEPPVETKAQLGAPPPQRAAEGSRLPPGPWPAALPAPSPQAGQQPPCSKRRLSFLAVSAAPAAQEKEQLEWKCTPFRAFTLTPLFDIASPGFDGGRAQLMVNKPVSSCSSLGPCGSNDAVYPFGVFLALLEWPSRGTRGSLCLCVVHRATT